MAQQNARHSFICQNFSRPLCPPHRCVALGVGACTSGCWIRRGRLRSFSASYARQGGARGAIRLRSRCADSALLSARARGAARLQPYATTCKESWRRCVDGIRRWGCCSRTPRGAKLLVCERAPLEGALLAAPRPKSRVLAPAGPELRRLPRFQRKRSAASGRAADALRRDTLLR